MTLPTDPAARLRLDRYDLPAARRGDFLDAMADTLGLLRVLPGFLGHTVLEHPLPGDRVLLVTVAAWASQDAIDAAQARAREAFAAQGVDPAARLARWGGTVTRDVLAPRG
ncbi:MAG: antibiotic biosynthesis monooxygenase family protein [Myxococcota bacterium]